MLVDSIAFETEDLAYLRQSADALQAGANARYVLRETAALQ